MALSERNVAYDISLFEERKIAIDPQKQDNIVKLPRNRVGARQNRKLNPVALLLPVVAFSLSVAVIGAIIFSQVQLTETTDQINKVTKQLEECASESTQLQMKIKEKLSPGMVEEYAKTNLHMEKTNPCQVEYFSLSSGDKAEVTQGKRNLVDKFLALVGIR